MRNTWYLAVVKHEGLGGGLARGRHVYVRWHDSGAVHVLGQHDVTAVLPLDVARQCLETVRGRDWQPVRIRQQRRASERWDRVRGGRLAGSVAHPQETR